MGVGGAGCIFCSAKHWQNVKLSSFISDVIKPDNTFRTYRRRIYFVEAVVIFLREEHKSLIYPGDHGETIIEKKFPSFVLG